MLYVFICVKLTKQLNYNIQNNIKVNYFHDDQETIKKKKSTNKLTIIGEYISVVFLNGNKKSLLTVWVWPDCIYIQ